MKNKYCSSLSRTSRLGKLMPHSKGNTVIVGMSGGVDSSVALYLLKKQEFEPIGVSLKYDVWQDGDECAGRRPEGSARRENVCCTKESLGIARKICKKLGVAHHVVDISKDFRCEVIGYFLQEHKLGQTPSPCVFCNRNLKFRKLLEFADKVGAKYVATGHYARVREQNVIASDSEAISNSIRLPRRPEGLLAMTSRYKLLKASDKIKDQTYSLCFLDQRILSRVIFPLGELTKSEVYKIAKKAGFNWFEKIAQSQDFCFVSGRDLPKMLEKEVGIKRGKIVDEKSAVLGEHSGLYNYTIGQRQGLGLASGPYFVIAKDMEANQLIVSKDKKLLEQKTVRLECVNFISRSEIKPAIKVQAKLRSAQKLAAADLTKTKNGYVLEFAKPQIAATPGQIAVFYLGQTCLGGGVIIGA